MRDAALEVVGEVHLAWMTAKIAAEATDAAALVEEMIEMNKEGSSSAVTESHQVVGTVAGLRMKYMDQEGCTHYSWRVPRDEQVLK